MQASEVPLPKKGGSGSNSHLSKDFVQRLTAEDPTTQHSLVHMLASRQRLGLLLEVQFGLSNRLRALASAKLLAQNSGRMLVVIWPQDQHCQASFDQLFAVEARRDFHVVPSLDAALSKHPDFQSLFAQYDLMSLGYDTLVDDGVDKHLYIRSAYSILSAGRTDTAETVLIRALLEHPSSAVAAHLDAFYDANYGGPSVSAKLKLSKHHANVGVHVRMITDVEVDTPGATADDRERFRRNALPYRLSCHWSFFRRTMHRFHRSVHFYLSADSPEAYAGLLSDASLKPRIAYLERGNCTSRSAACVQYALADLILLSSTRKLLKSKFSSYSILAERIGGMASRLGCDLPPGGWVALDKNDPKARKSLEQQCERYIQGHKQLLAPGSKT